MIRESGVSYNQTVEYDPLTADVISHVPEHERDGMLFRETTKIENVFLVKYSFKFTRISCIYKFSNISD